MILEQCVDVQIKKLTFKRSNFIESSWRVPWKIPFNFLVVMERYSTVQSSKNKTLLKGCVSLFTFTKEVFQSGFLKSKQGERKLAF